MNEEEKKSIEVFKNLVDDLDGAEDWANIVLNKEELKSLRTIKNLIEKQEKVIDEIKDYCNNDLSFERRLKRDKREPDLFNQGRFYTCQNIKDIIKFRIKLVFCLVKSVG